MGCSTVLRGALRLVTAANRNSPGAVAIRPGRVRSRVAEAARARQSTRRSGPGPARTHQRAVDATWTWDITGPTVHPRRRERQRRKHRDQWWSAPTDSLGTAVADTVGTFTWLLDDPNGTVEDTATSSAVTGTATFDAFGEQGSTSGSYATGNPLHFQGQYLDTVTGLYDLRTRDHDSGTGRFTAVHPLPSTLPGEKAGGLRLIEGPAPRAPVWGSCRPVAAARSMSPPCPPTVCRTAVLDIAGQLTAPGPVKGSVVFRNCHGSCHQCGRRASVRPWLRNHGRFTRVRVSVSGPGSSLPRFR
ncbi:hypothetical protein GCM10023080_065160 [Streptomyces pseudoechinosporeus]